ncbi:MAG: site-2 protease family protein, partial [bacterium]|nr:site-2 protease family protein [bacterium]
LFSISVHESAHGWMAEKFGDPTARNLGRITLNPIAHIDPIGSIAFPILLAIMGAPIFGWAKPVPWNPINVRDYRRANLYISAAGPISNIIVGVICIILYRIFDFIVPSILVSPTGWRGFSIIGTMLLHLVLINVILAVFNLMPIPPLDGSGILESTLRGNAQFQYQKIKPYGFIIFIIFIYSGALEFIANPIISVVFRIMLR